MTAQGSRSSNEVLRCATVLRGNISGLVPSQKSGRVLRQYLASRHYFASRCHQLQTPSYRPSATIGLSGTIKHANEVKINT